MNRKDRRRAAKFARIEARKKKAGGKWVTHEPNTNPVTKPADEHVCSAVCNHD